MQESGYAVLGNELSSLAVESFFSESNIIFKKEELRQFERYEGNNIQILKGDYFDLSLFDLSTVRAVFDRAALIALPEDTRARYIDLQISLLPKPLKILLLSLEYEDGLLEAPPYSVSETEIIKKYGQRFKITKLEEYDAGKERRHLVKRAALFSPGIKDIQMVGKIFLLED